MEQLGQKQHEHPLDISKRNKDVKLNMLGYDHFLNNKFAHIYTNGSDDVAILLPGKGWKSYETLIVSGQNTAIELLQEFIVLIDIGINTHGVVKYVSRVRVYASNVANPSQPIFDRTITKKNKVLNLYYCNRYMPSGTESISPGIKSGEYGRYRLILIEEANGKHSLLNTRGKMVEIPGLYHIGKPLLPKSNNRLGIIGILGKDGEADKYYIGYNNPFGMTERLWETDEEISELRSIKEQS